MRRLFGIHARGVAVALVLVASLLWLGAGVTPARAATAVSPWSPVPTPWGTAWAVHDADAFGVAGLAVAGDGQIAVTRDGGQTWDVVTPAGYAGTAFTAVAFSTSGSGVAASGGLLLVTSDWGATWRTPVYIGAGPGAAINDVAMLGSLAVAVGDAGMIYGSSDSGATWRLVASPTTSALTSVAIAGDGTEVAGAASGEILVYTDAWAVAGMAAGPVTAVAASDAATWGDGAPDLFAATGHDVLASDDALTFASLPGLTDLSSPAWPSLAWMGVPVRSLLIAGDLQAGFFGANQSWLVGPSGLNGIAMATAPGGQSVAYLLGADGRLGRTLSAGRAPAVIRLGKRRIALGGKTTLTANVRIAAAGTVVMRTRVPGHAWTDLRRVAWTAADWNRKLTFTLRPSLTHQYALQFQYGATTSVLAPVARLVVVPKVTTSRSRYDLRRGSVYRFSGAVSPRLSGERVELFTDRGGRWRPVSLQRSVKLRYGRKWRSRKFGTPKAETYHLRAHLPRTAAHAEAWSRVVTVAIH